MDISIEKTRKKRKRYRLLHKLEAGLETPMFLLAILWLVYFIIEISQGLTPTQEVLVTIIWGLFIFEFLLKLFLAPRKLSYIKHNWLTVIALVIPAFRVFRLLRAIRILQASRVVSTTKVVRALTSTKRFVTEVKEAQGPKPTPEMVVGVMVAHSRSADKEGLQAFSRQLVQDVKEEMESATGIKWIFHLTDPTLLESDSPHRPSDFLDDASLRIGEGPYDAVLVVTDVGLLSRRKRIEAGLASSVSRIMVLSTRKLTMASRGEPLRPLSSEAVRWNGATLLLHLLGHISGLSHKDADESKLMVPFEFREERDTVPRFNADERERLHKRGELLPEREFVGGTLLEGLIFHILMAFRHPKEVMIPLLKNGALFLPLSLPGLATAAVAPSFLLVFTAEIWDVGLNMSNLTTTIYAVASILAASFYLVRVQNLFLPRKEKRILTEHLAVANSVIFLSILLACIGLFILVGALMFVIEIYIFPEGLMKTWPTLLDLPEIHWTHKLRLAAFISTIGVTTGALAGGLDNKVVIQHLALFRDKP